MSGCPVSIDYLGASRNNITALPGVGKQLVNSLGDGVFFHGWVPDEKVHEISASASFGILLCDNARWSDACFPSKIPEFFALGVPVLCNLTSDLGLYLKDGHNGVVVSGVDVDAFCAAVEKALSLSRE
jgi:glycosyltransferase involved in cell wall biosynthesis